MRYLDVINLYKLNEEKVFIIQKYGKGKIMYKYGNKTKDELLDIIVNLERENAFLKSFIRDTQEFKNIEKFASGV